MDQTSLEQEIDRMIERTLNDHKVAPNHMEGLRNYLRRETQRDQRVSQLVRYQQEERQRMQQEFERQQKYLIQEICSEMDLSLYGDSSSETEEQPAEGSSPQEDEPREHF
ncbi:uncharacterized protein LOC117901160 [Drosophila subobscura]|uniref:uncharacterized protein LOC117901160 n=1 Tax=Drosophila subobscura TaxID=7241 RepID=UPI00155A5D9F|nr:uncharacterized protein LOC117901160 [Drosophila subobscura]